MQNKLISYALHFTSFLIEKKVLPLRVILYGSVATGEADEESDIDIFIDIDNSYEKKIRDLLKIFEKTFNKKWKMKGIKNPVSLIVGDLNSEKWEDLKRSMQSKGILLYGKYKEIPEEMESYLFFKLNFSVLERREKVNIWRKLYGYSQKVKDKKYVKQGIVSELNGKKLEKGIIIIPAVNVKKMKDFLKKNKVDFSVNEIWSDDL